MEISTKIPRAILIIFTLSWLIACNNNKQTEEDYLKFPEELTPETPYDVDFALEKKLLAENKFTETQRLFEILSWQMFISLNWPVDKDGKPFPSITDKGERIWESWKESFEIFKEDGSSPTAWGSITDLPKEFRGKIKKRGFEDVLFRTSKFSDFTHKNLKRKGKGKTFSDKADEINQAFTSPIWDQNGNIVRYEIRLNKLDVDYLTQNQLYNIDGQISFHKAGKKVSFPSGDRTHQGVFELKLAWKIMVPGKDFPERYFTKDAYVLEKNGSFSLKKVGLVGMHISTKTESSPQWIWATFEHVDNLETNDLEKIDGRPIKPTFYNPDCSTCPINVLPDTSASVIKNQIQRVLPIPMPTQALNKQVQSLLQAKKSVWQYYQLIGTQWPTDPASKPYPSPSKIYTLPEAVTNKAGGKPVPTYLTNMIMETYFQGGTIVGSGGAPSYYNKFLANEPAYFQIEGSPKEIDTLNTRQLIFGTEGCVGCHHSSGIAIKDTIVNGQRAANYGGPGSADFEWLLQLKAHFKK